jgi:hypothetical protein
MHRLEDYSSCARSGGRYAKPDIISFYVSLESEARNRGDCDINLLVYLFTSFDQDLLMNLT